MAFAPPVVNPSIPYVGPIPGGRLVDGCKITVQGKVPHHHHHGPTFSINLSSQPMWDQLGDTPLHLSVRLNEMCVVRNTLHGSWGAEERHNGMPFHKGQMFEVIIVVKPHQYKIHVNGKHFCDYKHRMPKERVQYLIISGGVEVSFIKFENEHGGPAPPPMPAGSYPGAGFPAGGGAPIFNPPMPFTLPIPGGLAPGRMISLSGIPSSSPQRFSVYLHTGQYPGGDVAMVFDVRFNFGSDRNVTIRNHRVANNWGSEERHQNYFPFMANANFDMIILADQTAFKVAVNNQHFVEFPYRVQPLHTVGCLFVDGDVRLTQVRLQ